MKKVDLSRLCSVNADVRELEVFPESWSNRSMFSLYENQPRPRSALFFVCEEIHVCFTEKNGRSIVAGKGDVVYIPKGLCYHVSVETKTGMGADTYTVDFRLFDETGEEITLTQELTVLTGCPQSRLELHLVRLCEAAHQNQRNCFRIRAEFYSLMDAVFASENDHDGAWYSIRDGVEALRSQWNQNVKIDQYAALCGVSSTYFYQCFRRWAGKSPVEYRNMLRLSNAETMLRLTDMRIAKIAETIGFEDSFYFCRLFTRQYGMSPQKYRKEARRGQEHVNRSM